MSKKNKIFTIYDFTIFLKNRIAIIILSTSLIAAITFYFQSNEIYEDHWEVDISRTVDNFSLMSAIKNIKDQTTVNSQRNNLPRLSISAVKLMENINSLMDMILINNLSNEDIVITGLGKAVDMNLMVKQNYYLIIPSENFKNIRILKDNLDKFFLDTNMLTSDLLKETYQLDRSFNLKIYKFKIEEMRRIDGYDYAKSIKILLISFVFCTSIIFIFHIRKFINLF